MSDTGGYDEYAFVADLYDYVRPYRERPDIPFFVDAAKDAGSPILEVGCGTGRILIPTARAGLEVVGLDQSPHMLAVCRDRLGQESPDVRSRAQLVQGDMRAFKLSRKFNLITVPFRPFQHLLTVKDQCACLESLRAHLTDDGRRVVRRHRIVAHDRVAQVNQVELLYYVTYPDGRRERLVHAFPMRYLFRFEAEHLLARCGFEVEHLYAGFDRSAYGSKYPGELIFVARKAAPQA